MHDVDGVENRDPFRLSVSAAPDLPPEVNVQLRGIGTAVTPRRAFRWPAALPTTTRWPKRGSSTKSTAPLRARRPLGTQPEGAPQRPDDRSVRPGRGGPRYLTAATRAEAGAKALSLRPARDAYDLGDAPHIGGSPRFQLDVVTASELRALLERRELGLRQRFEAIYEKMVGVRDLVDRIDLAPGSPGADDSTKSGEQPSDEATETPERRRERDLARLGGARQSATQLAFETTGVADGFDDILAELVNNRVDTEELKQRLEQGIAEPLKEIGGELLPRFEERVAAIQTILAANSTEAAQSLAAAKAEAQAIVDAMKAALDRMLELESYNELVELLRGIVTDQQELARRDPTTAA